MADSGESGASAQGQETPEERHARELIERGEAAKPGADGKLPPGATHEIVEDEPGKPPKVKRRRFSAY
jgi:hypothetical protein